jgi:aspartate racemase
MKTVGIVAHSFEGAALCFITACREGVLQLGPHMHPRIVMSAVPMALSLPAWEANDHSTVGKFLAEGVQMVADAGADFFVCSDNTAHIVMEQIIDDLPIPGLHIADVVCHDLTKHGWKRVGLLGTRWTMTGPVYNAALSKRDLERMIPDDATMTVLDRAIFDELCLGIFNEDTTSDFLGAIDDLKSRGAECVILGCTEIPLIVTPENSSLPTFDSTRLLAKYAILEAVSERPIGIKSGWIPVSG